MRRRISITTLTVLLAFVGSSAASSICSVAFYNLTRTRLEAELSREVSDSVRKLSSYLLGYFLEQKNWIHLEKQRKILSESNNVVYAYITDQNGRIEVGIDGLESSDIGRVSQDWEIEELPRIASENGWRLSASAFLAERFKGKLVEGQSFKVFQIPISSLSKSDFPGYLRVAISFSRVESTLSVLRWSLLGLSISIVVIVISLVMAATAFGFSSLKKTSREMKDFAEGKEPVSNLMRADSLVAEVYDFQRALAIFVERKREQDLLRGTARAVQMLAHDVRRPFSMFKSIIQAVEGTQDSESLRNVLNVTLPEINQAMASVEVMISDVMRMGSDTKMDTEDTAPEALVEASIGEAFRIFPAASISISYHFSHRHMVLVDPLKVGRVFSNIIGNAIHAMGGNGNLWFQTVEKDGWIDFVIGNTGSFIPTENLPRIFDAFFTACTKGGTGLGLAIAKQIVEAHGGVIRCESSKTQTHPSGMVEFIFALPASNSLSTPRVERLPQSSHEIHDALAAVRTVPSATGRVEPRSREVELESDILARIGQSGLPPNHKVTVLVVDDEAIYRKGILSLLERSAALSTQVQMVFARNDAEAIAAVAECRPVLVIEDVDLGPTSINGIELTRILRGGGFLGHICVHSNRFLVEDNKAALAAGADSVFPKPLGHSHFLKLLLASLPADPIGTTIGAAPTKLSVAMLDDSISMRIAWRMELENKTRFRAFESTGAFFETCESDPSFLSTLDVVITDYNFAPDDPHDGSTLVPALRDRGYEGLILKASGESGLGTEIEALFDGDIGKSALEWPAFEAFVRAASAKRTRR